MIPLRQREKYKVIAGMVLAGVCSYVDGNPNWAMWWLVNAVGVLWGVD